MQYMVTNVIYNGIPWKLKSYTASRSENELASLSIGRIEVDVLKLCCRCCSRAFWAILRIWASASLAFRSGTKEIKMKRISLEWKDERTKKRPNKDIVKHFTFIYFSYSKYCSWKLLPCSSHAFFTRSASISASFSIFWCFSFIIS